MHDIPLLKNDPLVDFLELLGHLEVHVTYLVQLDLNILLLGCPFDLLHLKVVSLLAKIFQLDGVPRLGDCDLLLQCLHCGLKFSKGTIFLRL